VACLFLSITIKLEASFLKIKEEAAIANKGKHSRGLIVIV
jgi:hypothetical protein